MKLEELLRQKGSDILRSWVDLILETYPADAQRFLKKQKNRFANPVGTTLRKEAGSLYKELLQGMDPERLSPILDRIVRIRAVQDFNPSQAIAFVFLLKKVIRKELEKEIQGNQLFHELQVFEARLDEVALLAFDIYMRCKENIYEIRANEARNQVSRLLRRAGLISEIPGWDSDQEKEVNDT
ncbi:MAG: RsbRD N-terminal domain-containing protein [Desulfobacteraceae bacterium]|jgi:hypothetical protein